MRGQRSKQIDVNPRRAWVSIVIVAMASSTLTVGVPAVASAASVTIADWQMNEAAGAQAMPDSSGNSATGAIGSVVQTGVVVNGATGYRWSSTMPNQPPAKPERLIQVPDQDLNPGTRDYAVTIRYRSTYKFGNIIQKGQAHVSGGYFKIEQPSGFINCFYTGHGGMATVKSTVATNDGQWHVIRCERTASQVALYIDGALMGTSVHATGMISNTTPLTIGGKLNCDNVAITCDYYSGDLDYVRIEAGSGGGGDTTPPTVPGTPSGTGSPGSISLGWAASTDQSPPITYRIYRDGGTTPVGQTTATSFTDAGLAAGSTHTYTIDATDAVGNASSKSPSSAPIAVPSSGAIFADDFSGGSFARWTGATRLTIDATQGSAATPSARGAPSAQSAFAYATLGAGYPSVCLSVNVNVGAHPGTGVDLFRLRTASDAPIVKTYVNASGVLFVRSDASGAQQSSGVSLGTGWHTIRLCGTVGTTGSWSLYRDGTAIVNAWTANTGTTPIGRIQIGDTAAKTWTANFDDVSLT